MVKAGYISVMACWLVVLPLLSGCQATDTTRAYFANPLAPGAEIVVRQALKVPPGLARVYLQYGQTIRYEFVDQYAPFCYFRMRSPLPVAQRISPGVLRVVSVSMDETEVRKNLPVRVAARSMFAGDGGRGPIAYQSHMSLSATDQPDLSTLVCSGAFKAPFEARPIRLQEMLQVFGDIAEIRVKPVSGTGR